MKNIEIFRLKDAVSDVKDHGTEVKYYLFDEYEIHLNKIPAHSIQQWHYHQQIEEVILVINGKLNCLYLENQKICIEEIKENELLRVKNSIHTLSHDYDQDCQFIVFRLILTGKINSRIFLEDKTEVQIK